MILQVNTLAVMAFFRCLSLSLYLSSSLPLPLARSFAHFAIPLYLIQFYMVVFFSLAFGLVWHQEHVYAAAWEMAIKSDIIVHIEMIIWNTIALILNACVDILSNSKNDYTDSFALSLSQLSLSLPPALSVCASIESQRETSVRDASENKQQLLAKKKPCVPLFVVRKGGGGGGRERRHFQCS